jgi:hypothetical protein
VEWYSGVVQWSNAVAVMQRSYEVQGSGVMQWWSDAMM